MSFSINPPPGIIKSSTPHVIGRRWADGDKVRFVDGKPQKIGGYQTYIANALLGKTRGLFGWSTIAGENLFAAGTYIKAYSVLDEEDDITPLRLTATLGSDPFETTDMSTTVVVTHSSHGGDENGFYVSFDGSDPVGGITPGGEYFATYIDANSYSIEHSVAATSSATGGGASVEAEYQINPGSESTAYGLGYGAGPYGGSTYGTPRSITDAVQIELRRWWFARHGNDLLMVPSGGTLYAWDEVNNAARGVAVSNAPTSIRAMFVTPERFVFALGADDPMTVKWPDQNDRTVWTSTKLNTAITRRLQVGNRLMAGTPLSNVSVVWTDISCYLFQYTGAPGIVYDSRLIGETAGIIGPGAFAVSGKPARAYWMSKTDFLYYDGSIQPIPNQGDIQKWVFDNLNKEQSAKIYAGYNPQYGEIWWGVPLFGSDEPNYYVAVSLTDFSWTIGTFDRTDMAFLPSANREIVMGGTDSVLYEHEVGLNAAGAAMQSYISTGVMMMGDGDVDTQGSRYIHDRDRQSGNLTVTLKTYKRPVDAKDGNVLEEAALTLSETATEEDKMFAGRHVSITFDSNVVDGDFRLGSPMLTLFPGGKR